MEKRARRWRAASVNEQSGLQAGDGGFDIQVKGDTADKAGGIGINVSLGSSQSQSRSTQTSDSARGSTLAAGQDITLVAAGAGQDSDLTLQGAQVQAGRKLLLAAADELKLLAAQNTASLQSDNQSSSGSIGVGFNTSSGFSVTASASKGKQNSASIAIYLKAAK